MLTAPDMTVGEQAAFLKTILESSTEYSIVAKDLNGNILAWNEGARRIYGYASEDVIGKSAFILHHPEDVASGRAQAILDEVRANGKWSGELRRLRKNGVVFSALVTITLRHAADGNPVGFTMISQDLTERQRILQELKESHEYNRGLIESNIDALMITDPLGIISDVNRQMCEMTGYTREELVGSPFNNYFTDPIRAEEGIRRVLAEDRVTNYELVLRSRTGKRTVVSFNAGTFKDTAGRIAGIFAAAREITEQKRLEEQLREQQAYTRSLIEANIDALMTTDTLGVITDVNRQMCEITGYSREELIGSPFKQYFTDPARAEQGIRLVLAEDRVTNYELTIRARDGRETVVSYNATTFRDADGRLRGVFAAARDITAQKALEEQIRKQNRELTDTTAFLNNVLESSTEYSIIAMDLDGRILNWNEGARRNYGYSAKNTVGKRNAQVLHTPADVRSGRVAAFMRTALETGKAEGVFEHVRKDGQRFIASLALTLLRDGESKPIGYVLISKDISEQKHLEEQLRRQNEELEEQNRRVQEANRLKSEFLANMSHELRTPLNAIIGFSELLHDGRAGAITPKQKTYVGDVLTSAHHLLQLINDVLDLSKVESGKMQFFPEPIDPARLVGEVCDILRTLTARKRITLTSEIDPALKEVVLDSAKLKQVLFNYLSNALKFTPENGRVTIRMRAVGADDLRLEVEDTGIGIRPEDLPRLFAEFQQLDSSVSKKYQGTGLGLALTKRIVEAQGGTVGVTSTVNRGSLFFAQLPRRASPPVPRNGGRTQRTDQNSRDQRCVLVIEDDPRDSEWLTSSLEGAGYAVVTAATGAEALRLLGERRFDAVTLDLLLPDLNGWEVLRRARAEGLNQNVPVLVVSVLSDKGTGVGFAISDFLEKPVKEAELLASVRRAISPRHGGKRVLLVDDDRKTLKLLEKVLQQHGYNTIARSDPRAALRAAVATPPDLVVLDLIMPRLDGFEFLRRFRATPSGVGVPVIVLSAKLLESTERELLGTMAQGIISKGDGSLHNLLAEIEAALNDSAAGPPQAAQPVHAANGQTSPQGSALEHRNKPGAPE